MKSFYSIILMENLKKYIMKSQGERFCAFMWATQANRINSFISKSKNKSWRSKIRFRAMSNDNIYVETRVENDRRSK